MEPEWVSLLKILSVFVIYLLCANLINCFGKRTGFSMGVLFAYYLIRKDYPEVAPKILYRGEAEVKKNLWSPLPKVHELEKRADECRLVL